MEIKFDFSDLRCPLLLIKIKQVIQAQNKGDRCEFRVSDASVIDDLKILSKKYPIEMYFEKCPLDIWMIRVVIQNPEPFSKNTSEKVL